MKIIFDEGELLGLKESSIGALDRLNDIEYGELFRFIQIATDLITINKINKGKMKIISDGVESNISILNSLESSFKELESEYLNLINKIKQEEK